MGVLSFLLGKKKEHTNSPELNQYKESTTSKEDESNLYSFAVKRLAHAKDRLTFSNSGPEKTIDTLVAMIENTDKNLYLYESHFDSSLYNNEILTDVLKKHLQNGRKIYAIIREEQFSEEFIKIYKAYRLSIIVRKATDDFIAKANSMIKKDNNFMNSFYFTGNSYRVSLENDWNVNNFNDSETSKHLQDLFDDSFENLDTVSVLQVKKTPSINEIIEKFKYVQISQKDLIDIVEFSQGKK